MNMMHRELVNAGIERTLRELDRTRKEITDHQGWAEDDQCKDMVDALYAAKASLVLGRKLLTLDR